jgi:hypothetical protein
VQPRSSAVVEALRGIGRLEMHGLLIYGCPLLARNRNFRSLVERSHHVSLRLWSYRVLVPRQRPSQRVTVLPLRMEFNVPVFFSVFELSLTEERRAERPNFVLARRNYTHAGFLASATDDIDEPDSNRFVIF